MAKRDKIFSKDCFQITFHAEALHHNMRLDLFVKAFMPTLSREFIKRKIVNGDIVFLTRALAPRAHRRVKAGDDVLMSTKNPQLPSLSEGELKVIYSGEDMLVVDKPPFMTAHPTGRHLFNCVTVELNKMFPDETFYSVHRLDRETSGLMIVARALSCAQAMTHFFESGQVQKGYLALVHRPDFSSDQNSELFFCARERLAGVMGARKQVFTRTYPADGRQGKSALTRFFILKNFSRHQLLLAIPKTGRQHQIRAHAFHHGRGLVGDKIYNNFGGRDVFVRFKELAETDDDLRRLEISRHALHAWRLELPLPEMSFEADLPRDFIDWGRATYNFEPEDWGPLIAAARLIFASEVSAS